MFRFRFPSLALAVLATLCGAAAPAQVLSRVQTLRDTPFPSSRSVVLSADDRHAYFAGSDSVALFDRDPTTGALVYRQRYLDGVGGVEGLRRPVAITLSPDDRHLYVATWDDRSLVTFSRDPVTGELEYLRAIYDGIDAGGLGFTLRLGFFPDGEHLFVAGEAFGCGDGECNWAPIVLFDRDPESGDLTFRPQGFDQPGFSTGAAASPDGRHVYSAFDGVSAMELNPASHELSLVQTVPLDGLSSEWVVVSPDGAHVYITGSGSVAALARDPATGLLSLLDVERNEENGVRGLDGAYYAAMSPDGRHLYVSSFRDEAFAVFARDPVSGHLTFVDTAIEGEGGFESIGAGGDLIIGPQGEFLYSARQGILERDPATGSLRPGGVAEQPGDDVDALHWIYQMAISPDGRQVFAGGSQSISTLLRSDDSVNLEGSAVTFESDDDIDALSRLSALEVSPDGRHLYAAGERFHATIHFTIDPESGALAQQQVLYGDPVSGEGLLSPADLALSPDGRHLYGIGGDLNRAELALFVVAPSTGSVSLEQLIRDDDSNNSLLQRADRVMLDPSGTFLYAFGDGTTALFRRDPTTGHLTFERFLFDASDEQVISPDGRHRYSASSTFLRVYSAEADGGLLHEVREYRLGVDEFEGMRGIRSLEVSPDGRILYALSRRDHTITALRRDPGTGLLTPIGALRQGENGEEGLLDARAMVLSADGTALYVAGYQEHMLSTFTPGCTPENQALCLGGERFRVEVRWRDGAGRRGKAEVVPFGSDDSALLWFFEEENWEMLIKVLDGCPLTGKFWVFAAATTDVEYTLTVTDTWTGATSSYFNPLGNAADAITDTDALASCSNESFAVGPRPFEPSPVEPSGPVRLPRAAKTADDREPREECLAGPSNLCLNQSRFRVEVAWENQGGERGAGEVVPFGSDDSGLFWFFEDTNWEMLIKVLDGCPANGHFWVFAAATTDVAYTLTVTDTVTGLSKAYLNPLGTAAPAITDTGFFACGG